MKRIIITLIWTLAFLVTIAQTNENSIEHMTFKGVPIDGTLNEYVSKLKNIGFTHIQTEDGLAILQGDFAGYRSCYLGVSTLKNNDLVNRIKVVFPEKDTWSTLSYDYNNLKELLTEKYGEPIESIEKFETYSEPRNDDARMSAIEDDRYRYFSRFNTDSGEIQLSIEHEEQILTTSCYVTLTYFDKINSDIIRKAAIDDL